jgi:hypothetical protein
MTVQNKSFTQRFRKGRDDFLKFAVIDRFSMVRGGREETRFEKSRVWILAQKTLAIGPVRPEHR